MSVAAGLHHAAASTSGFPVTVRAVNDSIYLEAVQTGAASNYAYSLTATSDNQLFTTPSFASASGTLSGGSDASAGSGSTTIYSYSIPTPPTSFMGYMPNGNLLGYTDSVMGPWNFYYDSLNRMTGGEAGLGPYAGLQMSWSYDSFGNRTGESFGGSTGASLPTSTTAQYNANNQVTGGSIAYDASGNVTVDNANQYLYDADGRVCAVRDRYYGDMMGYLYNAEGQRVAKGSLTTFSCDLTQNGFVPMRESVLGQSGEQLAELARDESGRMAWHHTNVYAAGALFASYDPNGLHFLVADWLGSRRAQTDYAGVLEQTCQSLPFGNGETCSPTPTSQLFTTYQHDTESGNDYAQARYYASSAGRFLSPDPSGLAYAEQTNPQSLNLYSYAMNNPLTMVDPTGLHWDCPPDTWDETTNTKTAHACHWVDDGYIFDGLLRMEMENAAYAAQQQQGSQSNTASTPSNTQRHGIIHSLYCSAESGLLAAAHISNSTVGFGAGGSAGAGLLFGYGVSAGVQEVADSHGNLGVAFNVGFSPGIGVFGLGAIIGGQASISTAKTIQGLSGTSTNFGGSAGGGLAGGFDVSKGENGTTTGNVTVGAGIGTKGAAMAIQHTWVPSSLSTNCGGG